MKKRAIAPDLSHESRLWALGYARVAGLDEAGRGAWAGPVVAAAVILPSDSHGLLGDLAAVRDSKQLSPARREALLPLIQRSCVAWAVGSVSSSEIDAVGIVAATRRAMTLALESLTPRAEALLIDYLCLPDVPLPQVSLAKGDALVLSIAAASILAKVSRDRMMTELDGVYPGFGLAQHKGYGTAQHRSALQTLGASAVHRASFAPMAEVTGHRARLEPATRAVRGAGTIVLD